MENNIIHLSDFHKSQQEFVDNVVTNLLSVETNKEKELRFYNERMEELKTKLFFIQKEMEITTFIIDMIEKEKITIIGQNDDNNTTHKE